MVPLLVNVIIILALAFLLQKKDAGVMKVHFWTGLLLRIGAGLILGFIYSAYYQEGDTFEYFRFASEVNQLANADLGQYVSYLWKPIPNDPLLQELNGLPPRALFFIKITSVLTLLSGGSYWVLSAYFSFISFAASWWLVKEIRQLDAQALSPALAGILYFPSVVFWTSGVVKESLAMACVYLVVVLFLRLWRKAKVPPILWVVLPLLVWILWNIKYYYVAILLPVVITSLVYRLLVSPYFSKKPVWLQIFAWVLIFTIPLGLVAILHPNFYPERFLTVITENNQAYSQLSETGDLIQFKNLQPTPWSIIRHSPNAILSGLFRPLPWEATNRMKAFASVENMVLVILSISALYGIVKKRIQPGILFIPMVTYMILLCVFLTLSTPNMGTLSRYRVGFLPFFVVMICYNNPVFLSLSRILQRSIASLFNNR